jgi:1-acyl-sn-glycerol-3-phosphate acyltransferase
MLRLLHCATESRVKASMFYIKFVLMCLWSVTATLLCFPFFWVPNAFPRWVRFVARGVLVIAGIRAEMKDAFHLSARRPCVIVGNHQSAFDFATFGAYIPNRCTGIGKRELAFLPLIGWYFALSGGFLIHRKNRTRAVGLLSDVAEHLREKELAVGIMPEGTRNLSGRGLLPFKKGAFHLAVEAQADIVVAVSEPLENIANFETRTLRPGTVHLVALPPIPVAGKTVAELSEIVRVKMLEELARFESKRAVSEPSR